MIDKLGLDGLGGASVRVEPTPQGTNGVTGKADAGPVVVGLEPVAFMTHHDEPMLFPTWDEAVQYCDDDEPPISLFHADDVAKLQAELATMTQERNNWKRNWSESEDRIIALREQLAASQAENEELQISKRNAELRAARVDDLIREAKSDDTRTALSMLVKSEQLQAENEALRAAYGATVLAHGAELAAMTQELDHWREANRTSLAAGDILKEQLIASQAYAQQLREALEICKKEMQGDKWDALYIDGVLANK